MRFKLKNDNLMQYLHLKCAITPGSNILDPKFNLHLRIGGSHHTQMIFQLCGERHHGIPQLENWRLTLIDSLL